MYTKDVAVIKMTAARTHGLEMPPDTKVYLKHLRAGRSFPLRVDFIFTKSQEAHEPLNLANKTGGKGG